MLLIMFILGMLVQRWVWPLAVVRMIIRAELGVRSPTMSRSSVAARSKLPLVHVNAPCELANQRSEHSPRARSSRLHDPPGCGCAE